MIDCIPGKKKELLTWDIPEKNAILLIHDKTNNNLPLNF